MPPEKMSVWYPDRTPKLVEEFVRLGVRWMDKHPDKTTPAAAAADLRLERERRRRILDADRQRRHRVPEGGAAGDYRGRNDAIWRLAAHGGKKTPNCFPACCRFRPVALWKDTISILPDRAE